MNLYNKIDIKINTVNESCRLSCKDSLTGNEAILIRKEINNCILGKYKTVYFDTKEVIQADLSGINEVIHSASLFNTTKTDFILVYRKNSQVEKWVETTGLNKFVHTAIIPAA